jgi:predicted alpha/beta hydrolase family esterase
MATFFLFHGTGGNPKENWLPWLNDQLVRDGHRVVVPAFPDADHPDLDRWLAHFHSLHPVIDGRSVFVGHSLGASFALHLLERVRQPIHAAFLVAPVSTPMGNDFDPLVSTFTTPPYQWNTIRSHCPRFVILQADNDPYVQMELTESLAKNLETGITIIPNGGHLNAKASYREFPLLLEMIREVSPSRTS